MRIPHLRKPRLAADQGVSPVIGVILMVAITVVLAASVYVWTSSFTQGHNTNEHAQLKTQGFDPGDEGETRWIRLTLLKGENAPYHPSAVSFEVVLPDGTVVRSADPGESTQRTLCETPQLVDWLELEDDSPKDGVADNAKEYRCTKIAGDQPDDQWDIGQTLYLPCLAEGANTVTATLRDTTLFDDQVRCDGFP